ALGLGDRRTSPHRARVSPCSIPVVRRHVVGYFHSSSDSSFVSRHSHLAKKREANAWLYSRGSTSRSAFVTSSGKSISVQGNPPIFSCPTLTSRKYCSKLSSYSISHRP